jgi:hypothetical protein
MGGAKFLIIAVSLLSGVWSQAVQTALSPRSGNDNAVRIRKLVGIEVRSLYQEFD